MFKPGELTRQYLAGRRRRFVLPSFALFLKLAYFNRRMRYTEHHVFALHVHAFWFLLMAALATGVSAVIGAIVLIAPLYSALAGRRVYGGRRSVTLLRGLAVMSAYGATLIMSLVLVVVWTFLA